MCFPFVSVLNTFVSVVVQVEKAKSEVATLEIRQSNIADQLKSLQVFPVALPFFPCHNDDACVHIRSRRK